MQVKLARLKIDADGLTTITEAQSKKLYSSIKLYGQLRNIIIDGAYNVIEGRRIALIMEDLKKEYIEVNVFGVDIDEKNKLQIRLNLNSSFSQINFVDMSNRLTLMKTNNPTDFNELITSLPFRQRDIEDYITSTKKPVFKPKTNKKGVDLLDLE